MTVRGRDSGFDAKGWITSGWNLKTILLMLASIASAYYTLGTRTTTLEQALIDHDKRLDHQRTLIEGKVNKDTYDADQRRLAESLAAIQQSQGRIETILMEQRK